MFISGRLKNNNMLLNAAEANDIDNIKKAIKNGANIDAVDEYDYTPLMLSCAKGILENVEYLVEHGANIDKKNVYGETALMKACYRGHLNIVKYLIEKNAKNFYWQ
jgi:ankyrin repeat protein